jgi:hypothetical protein
MYESIAGMCDLYSGAVESFIGYSDLVLFIFILRFTKWQKHRKLFH